MVLSLTELGNRLKEKRIENNYSLDELQNMTKIQKRYLEAIEEGNYDILPGQFYARAFAKQYAEAVGLDPEVLFHEYENDLPKSSTENIPERISRAQKHQNNVSTQNSKFFSLLPKLLVFILIIGIAVSIWLFLQRDNDSSLSNSEDDTEQAVESELGTPTEVDDTEIITENDETKTETKDPVEQPEEEAAPIEEKQQLIRIEQGSNSEYIPFELKGAEKLTVQIEANPNANCYLGIKNGKGKSFYGQEISNGESVSFDFSSEEEMLFNVGNTKGVVFTINNEPFTFPTDKAHQKVKIIFAR